MAIAGIDVFLVAVVTAMVANGSAALVKKGHPLDAGLRFIDGRRILGDGKTVEGFLTGFFFGVSVGLATTITLDILLLDGLKASILAALGALVGDIAASFVKRRLGLPRGAKLEIVDQLDFYVGAIIFVSVGGYDLPLMPAIAFAALVYMLHRLTNIAAYKLGIKDRPW